MMTRAALVASLLLYSCPSSVAASPCTDACLQQQINESVGCIDQASGGYLYGYPEVELAMCIAASMIAMYGCIQGCLGAPTGGFPSAIASASTPMNQVCFGQSERIQLSVSVDSLYSGSVQSVGFYLSGGTAPPIHLFTDNTPADGFTLTYVPSGLPSGHYLLHYYLYDVDPVADLKGGSVFGVQVGSCPVSVSDESVTDAEGLRLLSGNPTRGDVHFAYRATRAGMVEATVLDLAGRMVARPIRGYQPAGEWRGLWDGRDEGGGRVKGGAYFLRVAVDGEPIGARKLLLLR